MKRIAAHCFTLLLAGPCVSQIQTTPLSSKDSIRISLKKEVADNFPAIPLKKIIVVDARPEKGTVGYLNLDHQIAQKYIFRSTAEKEITSWYSKYLRVDSQNVNAATLLVNIKKLRVSKNVLLKASQQVQDTLHKKRLEQGVVVKIELFLQQDSFFVPLYRFDSTIFIRGKLPKDAGNFLTTALSLSVSNFLWMNTVKTVNNRRISLEDILRSNDQVNDFPVNQGTGLKKGIYKTFKEFKMNAPSITVYEYTKSGSGLLYINENGNVHQLKDNWGFCDGENYFINIGYSYSKLVRTENSFYFSGSKNMILKEHKGNPDLENFAFALLEFGLFGGYFDPTNNVFSAGGVTYEFVQRHYQVDMETGEFY